MDDAQQLRRLMKRASEVEPPFEPPPAERFRVDPHARRRARLSVAAAVLAVLALLVPVTLLARSPAHNHPAGTPNTSPTLGAVSAVSLDHYRWSTLPAAPIASRSGAVGVWTGTQMIVWGGASDGGAVLHADGAAYDPDTRTWTTLPSSPLNARTQPASVWTGRSVFIWGGSVNSDATLATDGALYTPADHSWTRVPAAPVTHYTQVRAFWTGSVVVLVSTPPRADKGSVEVNAQAYNPATRSWKRLPDLRLPRVSGLMLDPSNASIRPIRHGPVDDLNAEYLWTGDALLAFNTGTETSGLQGNVYPGRAAAWSPTTNTWTTLPDAPLAGNEAIAVWTGKALLIWGDLYTPRGAKHVATTGLEFAP